MASLIDLYSLVVLAAIVMSWIGVDPRNPIAGIAYRLTEPILDVIRRALPPIGGLDFSPMVLLFALQTLKRFV